MNAGYHTLIAGGLFVLISLLFQQRSKNNVYNKGWEWFFFALFHGIDEIADGLNQILNVDNSIHLILEKVEIIFFMLSATFLLIGTLIRLNLMNPKDIFKIGFFIQIPPIIFFVFLKEIQLDSITSHELNFLNYNIELISIVFGAIPTIPLIIAYIWQIFNISGKMKDNFPRKLFLNYLMVILILAIYAISEMFSSINILFVYFEIFSFSLIIFIPVELNLGAENNLQLFLMYHVDGMMVSNLRFNTGLAEDTLILISGFLSAINTMVSSELNLGSLEKVETNQGLIITKYQGNYIYSLLVKNLTITIQDQLTNFISELNNKTELPKDSVDLSKPVLNEIESLAISYFIS